METRKSNEDFEVYGFLLKWKEVTTLQRCNKMKIFITWFRNWGNWNYVKNINLCNGYVAYRVKITGMYALKYLTAFVYLITSGCESWRLDISRRIFPGLLQKRSRLYSHHYEDRSKFTSEIAVTETSAIECDSKIYNRTGIYTSGENMLMKYWKNRFMTMSEPGPSSQQVKIKWNEGPKR